MEIQSMVAATIKEAKAKLNELVGRAERGEEVVLMRGAKHVAAIIPITEADLSLSPQLSDAVAKRLWQRLAVERESEGTAEFNSPEDAVAHLR